MTPATVVSRAGHRTGGRPRTGGGRSRPPAGVVAAAVLVTLGTLIPLGFVIVMTVLTGWDSAARLIFRPRVGELLFNTVALILLTVPLCIVIGIGAAWLVERTTLPGARFWSLVLAAPLAVP